MTEQPTTLQLAEWLGHSVMPNDHKAAAELHRLHEEVTEQGRLLSMSAERELALLARIDRLEKLNAELLEALKDVVEDADDCGCHENDKRCPLRHAEKIIAKAGEQA